jgi:hypothetical protein
MLDEQRIYEYGGLLAAGYGLYQAKKIHDTELEKARQRHLESIELAKKQHENDMKTVKQTYLLELFNSLEQHFQQLNADLIASSRESERDMFDQRNQSFQTIILASTVMFSALASIIVDGNLPLHSGAFLLVAYSLTCSLSFSFLFLCIVFCIELVIRTSSFMYKRGKSHTRSLRKAINDTKGMMRELRGEGKGASASADNLRAGLNVDSLKDTNKPGSIRRAISRMKPSEIETEFERHEAEIRGYLKKREVLNDSAAITSYRDEVTGVKRPFKHFWEESCETWWSLAILLFYGGSLNMLLALMIYMWAQYYLFYNSIVAAVIGVSLLGLILVVGVATVIVMRHVDRQTEKHEMQDNTAALNSPSEEASRVDYSSSTVGADGSARQAGAGWTSIPFLNRHRSTSTTAEEAAMEEGSPRGDVAGAAPPVVHLVGTDSTRSMTATPSSGATSTPQRLVHTHAQSPSSVRTPALPVRNGSIDSNSSRTSSRGGRRPVGPAASRTMDNLPSRLETHVEDIEAGSVMTDSSVNSVLTIPPHRGAHAEHIFQEEPSPRRRFLSAFSSGTKKKPQESPSLYMSALRGAASAELNRQSMSEAPSLGEMSNPAPSSQRPSLGTPAQSFQFPKSLPPSGNRSQSAGRGGSGQGGSRYTPGRNAEYYMESNDSNGSLSNMSGSGSGGAITF